MILVAWLRLAEEEFPFLMRQGADREDALQVLQIVYWESQGTADLERAREVLAQLARNLGYQPAGSGWRKVA